MEHLLKTFPVIVEISVAWGEMDALKHVNNIVYFRYFENARIAYLEKLKFWDHMSKTGIGPILASTKCKYKVPLTFPDKILVGARTSEIKEDRFVMQYAIVSRRLQKIAAEGEAVLVSYSYREGKKAPPSTKAPIHKPPKSDFLSPIQLPRSNTQRRLFSYLAQNQNENVLDLHPTRYYSENSKKPFSINSAYELSQSDRLEKGGRHGQPDLVQFRAQRRICCHRQAGWVDNRWSDGVREVGRARSC